MVGSNAEFPRARGPRMGSRARFCPCHHASIDLEKSLTVREATERISSWLRCGNVSLIEPSPGHWERLRQTLARLGMAGNLTTDAHLAILALEHNAEIHSSDQDFSRFAGLRWKNPIERET